MHEVFYTYFQPHPDYNFEDIVAESNRLFQRQRAIQAMLDGILPPDILLDMLDEHGIDPIEYVNSIATVLLP